MLEYVKEMLHELEVIHRGSTMHRKVKNDTEGVQGVSDTKTQKLFSCISECSSKVQPQRGSQGSFSVSLMLKQYAEEGTLLFFQ